MSLDSQARETVNKNMIAPTLSTFDEAQLQIFMLMHRDSYPRFLQSSLFRKLLAQATGDSEADGLAPAGELKLTVTVSEKENSGGTPAASGGDGKTHSPPSGSSSKPNAHASRGSPASGERERSRGGGTCASNAPSAKRLASKCKKQ